MRYLLSRVARNLPICGYIYAPGPISPTHVTRALQAAKGRFRAACCLALGLRLSQVFKKHEIRGVVAK
jgi:hypothetical protein